MIIQQTRWKCDYCGVVSPVIDNPKGIPKGWEVHFRGADWLRKHFCCHEHRKLWVSIHLNDDDSDRYYYLITGAL